MRRGKEREEREGSQSNPSPCNLASLPRVSFDLRVHPFVQKKAHYLPGNFHPFHPEHRRIIFPALEFRIFGPKVSVRSQDGGLVVTVYVK